MFISYLSNSVRFTGRWAKNDTLIVTPVPGTNKKESAVTTAPGAYFEAAFNGDWCDLRFDISNCPEPLPHLYVQVDGGAKIDVRIAHYIRIETPTAGNHVVTVYFKSSMESLQRWHEPLGAKVDFLGFDADAEGVLPEDNRKIIQFLGDSITEGTWVDDERTAYGAHNSVYDRNNLFNTQYQNDSTATYAYHTAKLLGMRPYITGYGCLGLIRHGNGGLPAAAGVYPYYFDGHPIERDIADIIVINYGANDFMATADEYTAAYEEFLGIVRSFNPSAKIVVMSAFLGRYPEELSATVARYNKEHDENILFIDATDWVPKEPVHPTREGHQIIARKLTDILTEHFNLEPHRA